MQKKGFILPTTLLIILVLMTIALATSAFNLDLYRDADSGQDRSQALLAAETGVEFAVQRLNQTPPASANLAETVFVNSTNQGRVTYQTVAESGDTNEVAITAIGRVYKPQDSDEPVSVRRVRAVVVGTSDEGEATVRAGQHLNLSGSATIANGKVYVNGTLTLSGGTRIGTAQTPVEVRVAHNACPNIAHSSYPSPCTSGQPISISHGQWIYGEVHANNQTTGGNFMSNPGLVSSSGVNSQALDGEFLASQHDREAQKSAVVNTISASSASCGGNNQSTLVANTRVSTGNVNLVGSCKITIEGDVWIQGNLSLGGNSDIRVSENLTEPPTIMIDGSNGLSMGGSGKILANSNDVGVRVITYHSTASCSPDCSEVTGVDLYNSQSIPTISIGGGSNNAPASIFYAAWTRANIGSGVSIGRVAGQQVYLSGAGNVTFGGELSSGDKVWTIKNYQQL